MIGAWPERELVHLDPDGEIGDDTVSRRVEVWVGDDTA